MRCKYGLDFCNYRLNTAEMEDIKIENNLNVVCHGCLSSERNTSALGQYSEMFLSLIGNKTQGLIYSAEDIKICWECMAVLKKFKSFQNQLKKAQNVLMQMLYELNYNPITLSKLKISNKYYYDQDYQYIDNETKSENEESSETNIDTTVQNTEPAEIVDYFIDTSVKEEVYNDYDSFIDDDYKDETDKDNEINYTNDIADIGNVIDSKKGLDAKDTQDVFNKELLDVTVESNYVNESKIDRSKIVRAKRRKLVQSRENSVSYYKQYATLIQREKIDWGKVQNYFTMITFGEKEMEEHFLSKERKFSEYSRFKYKCVPCQLGFMKSFDLKRHCNLNHPKTRGTYKCSVCHKSMSTLDLLEKHWREHTPIAKCNICGDVCRPRGMKNHLNYAHTKKYACQFCKLEFGKILHFSRHYKEMHQDYYCDYCNACCKSKTLVQKHIRTHHTKFTCKECNKQYPNYRQYKRHNYEVHPDKFCKLPQRPEMAYCVECDKQYPNERKYKKHLKVSPKHTEIKQVLIPCPDCGKIFRRKNYFNNHYNLFHLKKSKYHCTLCDKYFANGYGLRKHTTHVHLKVTRIKDKMCDICGRGFTTNRILENHRRTHTGERPYQCPFCVAAFTQKQAMQSHCRTQHKDMK